MRNAAFLGKSVGINDTIPTSWKIDISKNGSGKLMTSYMSGSWINYGKNWSAKVPYEVSTLSCKNLTGTLT